MSEICIIKIFDNACLINIPIILFFLFLKISLEDNKDEMRQAGKH